MAKQKVHFIVYSRYYFKTEFPEDSFNLRWEKEGDTWAVSEKQAINNVRHRNYGDYGSSQYKSIGYSSSWENGLEWKAEQI